MAVARVSSATWMPALAFAFIFLNNLARGAGLSRPCNDGMVLRGNIETDVEHTAGDCTLYFARINGSLSSFNGTKLIMKASAVDLDVRTSGTTTVSAAGVDLRRLRVSGARSVVVSYGEFLGDVELSGVSESVSIQSSTIGACTATGVVGEFAVLGNLVNGAIDVRGAHGNITIDGNDVVGGLDVHDVNGTVGVQINNFAGDIAASDIAGDLSLLGMTIVKGGIDVRNVNGTVTIGGNNIDAGVDVADVDSLDMHFNNAGGDFNVSGVLGDMDLEENTLDGGIELRALGGSAALRGNYAEGSLSCWALDVPQNARQLTFENTINGDIEGECALNEG